VDRLGAATASRLAAGAQLRASIGDGWLVVIGDASDLPWVDGVTYLGWSRGVLLPTTAEILPGPEAIRAAIGAEPGELVVVLPDSILVSAMPTRIADASRLPS
jgi:hypothetical protein